MSTNQSNTGIFIILLAVAALVLVIFIRKKIKVIKVPSVYLITGAVKTGKSFLSVHFAVKEYRKAVRLWHIKRVFCFLFHRECPMKPMLYSNIPLRWVRFNRFTLDILLRQKKIPPKSIVLLDEASLIADSMLFKDKKINNELMLFLKLFGHMSLGGKCIINTQSLSDLHFSFKRCINNYCFIYSSTKVPFFTIMKVREMMYSDDKTNITNAYDDDLELSMRTLLVFNRVYKMYDCYCYSIFTDDLPCEVEYNTEVLTRWDSLKTNDLITLQDFKDLLEVRIHENEGHVLQKTDSTT